MLARLFERGPWLQCEPLLFCRAGYINVQVLRWRDDNLHQWELDQQLSRQHRPPAVPSGNWTSVFHPGWGWYVLKRKMSPRRFAKLGGLQRRDSFGRKHLRLVLWYNWLWWQQWSRWTLLWYKGWWLTQISWGKHSSCIDQWAWRHLLLEVNWQIVNTRRCKEGISNWSMLTVYTECDCWD